MSDFDDHHLLRSLDKKSFYHSWMLWIILLSVLYGGRINCNGDDTPEHRLKRIDERLSNIELTLHPDAGAKKD